MFRKRLGAPRAGEPSRPVLFFVHGSSVTSRGFDLNVPGHGEYSIMNEFARYGFDCWTMDHENYGKSGRTSGNSDIASGVEDLKVAADVVIRETGRQKFHFIGESSGALRAGAYAMVRPDRVDRLVLAAFTYKGEGSPTLTKRAEQLDYYRSHNMRKRDRDMIRSISTRDKPGTSDPAAVEVLADVEMQFGDQVPTGTYLDMTANLPVVHPDKVLAPVLLVRGEYDGIATDRRPRGVLQQAAERRPPVRHPARHRAFGDPRDQPPVVLACDPRRSSPCRRRLRPEVRSSRTSLHVDPCGLVHSLVERVNDKGTAVQAEGACGLNVFGSDLNRTCFRPNC